MPADDLRIGTLPMPPTPAAIKPIAWRANVHAIWLQR